MRLHARLGAALLLLSAARLLGAGVAGVTYSPDRLQLSPGEVVSIDVTLDVASVGGSCSDGLPASLNGYQLAASFDPAALELLGVDRCASAPAELDRRPVSTRPSLAARAGSVVALSQADFRTATTSACTSTFRFRALRPGPAVISFGPSRLGRQKASLVCQAQEFLPISIPDGLVRLEVGGKVPPLSLRVCQTLCLQDGKGATTLDALQLHDALEAQDLAKFLDEGPLGPIPGATVQAYMGKVAVQGTTVFPSGTNTVDFTYTFGDSTTLTASGNLIVRREGDLDEDDVTDIFDVVVASAYLVGNLPAGIAPFSAPACCLETNADGRLDIFDLINLMGHVAGNVPCLEP